MVYNTMLGFLNETLLYIFLSLVLGISLTWQLYSQEGPCSSVLQSFPAPHLWLRVPLPSLFTQGMTTLTTGFTTPNSNVTFSEAFPNLMTPTKFSQFNH